MLIEAPSCLKSGDKVNLIGWMNFEVKSIDYKSKSVHLHALPDDKEFRSPAKLNYVNPTSQIEVQCNHYSDLITKPVLTKEDDFKQHINRNSVVTFNLAGEESMKNLKAKDSLQIYRHGLFIVAKGYS